VFALVNGRFSYSKFIRLWSKLNNIMGQGHPQHIEVSAAKAGYTSIDVQCGIFSKLRV
jgi:hypothetical protein